MSKTKQNPQTKFNQMLQGTSTSSSRPNANAPSDRANDYYTFVLILRLKEPDIVALLSKDNTDLHVLIQQAFCSCTYYIFHLQVVYLVSKYLCHEQTAAKNNVYSECTTRFVHVLYRYNVQ